MYITLKDGRKIRMPSDEEDAAIHAAAMSDPDCPPMTEEQLASLRPAREALPAALYTALTDKANPVKFVPVPETAHPARVDAPRQRDRPPLDAPKKRIAIQLDADVLDGLRATGAGWQTRVNALLREAVATGRV